MRRQADPRDARVTPHPIAGPRPGDPPASVLALAWCSSCLRVLVFLVLPAVSPSQRDAGRGFACSDSSFFRNGTPSLNHFGAGSPFR